MYRFLEDTLAIDAYEAHAAAILGNDKALGTWELFGGHLGAVIKTIMYTYDPEAIVLGGSITKANQFFKQVCWKV